MKEEDRKKRSRGGGEQRKGEGRRDRHHLSGFQHCRDFPLNWADQQRKNICPENAYACMVVKSNPKKNTGSRLYFLSFLISAFSHSLPASSSHSLSSFSPRKEKKCEPQLPYILLPVIIIEMAMCLSQKQLQIKLTQKNQTLCILSTTVCQFLYSYSHTKT